MKSSFIAVLISMAPLAVAQETPQAAAPRFPSEVELVTVDVVVADKKGQSVTDLGASDFTLIDDGTPQSISSFEKVELPALAQETPPPPPPVSTNMGAETRTGRSFVLVFDDLHLTPLQAVKAKEAVVAFLKTGTREGDRVTLLATGGGTWWTVRMESGRQQLLDMVKRFEGRNNRPQGMDQMGEHEAMRIHVYHDTLVAARVMQRWESLSVPGTGRQANLSSADNAYNIDPFVGMRALEVYEAARQRNTAALEIIQRAVGALTGTRGRKSMILVSEGFINDPNLDQMKRVVQEARRANVAIYFLDVRGLTAMPRSLSAETGPPPVNQEVGSMFIEHTLESAGSEQLASDSGGFTIKNTNDLGGGIQRIANESRAYYLIGYNPTNPLRDGRWRKIQVKVNRKNVNVRARKGYYAPFDEDPSTITARKQDDKIHDEFRRALDSPRDAEGIPLRLTAYVMGETILGKATTMIVADVNVSAFRFEEQDGRFVDTAEVVLVANHRETGEYWDRSETVELGFASEPRQTGNLWYTLTREFELPPGVYQAKLAVRHKKTGRLGSVTHEFDVPKLGELRLSTVVLSDAVQPPKPGEGPQPRLVARRALRPVGPQRLVFGKIEVYGAAKDDRAQPKVSFSYAVRNKDGTTVKSIEPREVPPNDQGAIRQLFAFTTQTLPAGDYELLVTVRDEITGKSKDVREPFTIELAAEEKAT